MRKGFQVQVISPAGIQFSRKSWDKTPGDGSKIQQRIPFYWYFDETPSPNIGKITLINITNAEREGFQYKENLQLRLGWLPQGQNDQLVIDGTILNIHTEAMESRTTFSSDITFRDTPLRYHEGTVSRYWPKGTPATEVLKNLIQEEVGVNFQHFQPTRQPTYRRGKSFYGPVMHAIQQVVSDVQSKFFFFNKQAYLLPHNGTLPPTLTLRSRDLVKGIPSKTAGKKQIYALLNTRIKPAMKVSISSDQEQGTFHVFSGKHYSPEGKKFRTLIKGKLA